MDRSKLDATHCAGCKCTCTRDRQPPSPKSEEIILFGQRFDDWAKGCDLVIVSGYHRTWPAAGQDAYAVIQVTGAQLRRLAFEFYSWGIVDGVARSRRLNELFPLEPVELQLVVAGPGDYGT